MGLPIAVALPAVASGLLLLGVGASFLDIPDFTTEFAAMIGIGVGIDYALLIMTRYREGIARNLAVEDAIVRASATAGRSVVFAGSTVVIALLGLWVVGVPLLAYMATGAALVVALSVVMAVVVLPAILKLAGTWIDRWRIPLLAAAPDESETGFGYRLSRLIQRAPLPALAVSLGVLLVLAIPVLRMDVGVADAGNNPVSTTSRRAYDLLSEGFGPGFNGPILVAVRIDGGDATDTIRGLPSSLQQVEGVASVLPANFNEARSAATITVIPETAPQSQQTEELVDRLRRVVLSVGAAYGVLVAVFQWGWFGSVFGVDRGAPIESDLPIVLFAVLFGLSMDYEVFLISRIREEYLKTGNNTEAVARGLSATTRVISAAAAIMVAVFLSFSLSDERVIKQAGVGLATAIFLDATVVRLILVPALMQLLGDANWWFPRWLDRLIPKIGVDEGP
jgi:RND superfamily putative drug exporter